MKDKIKYIDMLLSEIFTCGDSTMKMHDARAILKEVYDEITAAEVVTDNGKQ